MPSWFVGAAVVVVVGTELAEADVVDVDAAGSTPARPVDKLDEVAAPTPVTAAAGDAVVVVVAGTEAELVTVVDGADVEPLAGAVVVAAGAVVVVAGAVVVVAGAVVVVAGTVVVGTVAVVDGVAGAVLEEVVVVTSVTRPTEPAEDGPVLLRPGT